MTGATGEIRLSEVIHGMSYALDVTEGESAGAARSCLIGMRLAEELGLDATARSDLFYALLLKDAGCSANSARMAALFGTDDHRAKRTSKRVELGAPVAGVRVGGARRRARADRPRARADRLLAVKREGEVTRSLMQARCERGAEVALHARAVRGHADAIYALDEHWDGGGYPHGLRGRRDPAGGAHPVPGADRRDLPRGGRRQGRPTRWRPSAAAAGSTRRSWTRWGAFRADHRFWALVRRTPT